jgi:K+ transporter
MHTNAEERGQVYIPEVNGVLCMLCLLLVVAFRNTDRLGSAYGVAVTGDALITTILFSIVLRRVWRWPYACILMVATPMLCIDLSFWSANIIKILQAGWVPCAITVVCCMLMHTYHWGRTREDQRRFDGSDWHERRRLSTTCAAESLQEPLLSGGVGPSEADVTKEDSECPLAPWRQGAFSPLETMPINDAELIDLLTDPGVNITRTNACTVFMTPRQGRVPLSLQSLAHSFCCLPRTIVLLTVSFEASTPFVSPADRASFDAIDVALGVYRIVLYFGYAEPLTAVQNMRDALGKVARKHLREYPELRPLLVLSTTESTSDPTDADLSASRDGPPSPTPKLLSGADRQYDSSLTFVVNRLNYKTAPGHSWFTKFRIGLYRLMVFNARKPIRFFGLPADCTVEVSSIKYL